MNHGYDVKDKAILVTGANRGIGMALVEGFFKHGARKIYAAVRTLSKASALVDIYGTDKLVPIYIDLENPASIEEAATVANDVQVVINNAGVLDLVKPMSENAMPALQHQMEVNVYGLVHMAQHFVPVLESNGGGAFVQINSLSSLRCPGPKFFAYAASKSAAFAVVQGLRTSLKNTLVVSVHPGPIATDMVDQFGGRDRAEPPSRVADTLVDAMKKGEFLVYPDRTAREIGSAYEGFAKNIIESKKYQHPE
mmetsp:Transcript_10820/g.16624  ORF Transcript_10820/g.16624 Transcript_10820/m.16624 type:complete len:252 (-) Transcript_10820:138-893(-)|eukprot:CAMPEP_0178897912 /NCGR_PEP_ID=MMETSP0786-20121207/2021_1 /TAXON_ID=186022 /ORGANISM="Thalassionema frauenfeldii, Strain CCMP 1798" /LENGTH=251 /DNA_ID=CAMNT_0020568537 /DNA_START=57 /DNA_END=812 /DNA_ORIENTATION=-